MESSANATCATSDLAEGEAPACVQACPTEAIRIVKHKTVGNRDSADVSLFKSTIRNSQSAVPHSRITLPTTRYIGRQSPATTHAADRENLHPEHAHWPLVFMLALTQAGLGLCAGGLYPASQASLSLFITGAIIFNLGMVAATLHLGQPLKAWRFFLGLKTSWLSREILAFSMVAPLPLVLVALQLTPDFPFKNYLWMITAFSVIPASLGAIFTSVMIYQDTKRESWRFPVTATRFFGTFLAFSSLALVIGNPDQMFIVLFALALVIKSIPELYILSQANDAEWSADRHTARVLIHSLKPVTIVRFALVPLALIAITINPWAALPILLISEMLERQLFFQSCHAPKMPGHFG